MRRTLGAVQFPCEQLAGSEQGAAAAGGWSAVHKSPANEDASVHARPGRARPCCKRNCRPLPCYCRAVGAAGLVNSESWALVLFSEPVFMTRGPRGRVAACVASIFAAETWWGRCLSGEQALHAWCAP